MCVSELVAMTHDCACLFCNKSKCEMVQVTGITQKVGTIIMGDVTQLCYVDGKTILSFLQSIVKGSFVGILRLLGNRKHCDSVL